MRAGGYGKAVPGPTGLEWLSHNEDNVAAYIADGECTDVFADVAEWLDSKTGA